MSSGSVCFLASMARLWLAVPDYRPIAFHIVAFLVHTLSKHHPEFPQKGGRESSQPDRLELHLVVEFLPPQRQRCFVGQNIVGQSGNDLVDAKVDSIRMRVRRSFWRITTH